MSGINPVDKLVDLIPGVVDKAGTLINKAMEKPKQVLKVTNEENKSSNE